MAVGSAAISLWDAWEKGFGSGLIRTAQWVAQDHGYLLPLLALLFVYGITRTGWQFKIPSLGQQLASLTKPVDLRDVFTGTRSLTRVQVLMTGPTPSTQSHAAMVKAEVLFARWYGDGMWTPMAFDRSLLLAVVYPLLSVLVVWLTTGVGRTGLANWLPSDWALWMRVGAVGLMGLCGGVASWLQLVSNRTPGRVISALYLGVIALAFFGFITFDAPGAIAFVVAFVSTSAFAVSNVFAAKVTVATAGASAFVVGYSTLWGFAGAFVCLVGIPVLLVFLQEKVRSKLQEISQCLALAWFVGTWFGWLTLATVVAPRLAEEVNRVDSSSVVFWVLFFAGILPVWNAILDLVSVNVTRWLLRRYLRTGNGWRSMVLLDMAVAIGLSALLFFGVLAMLKSMQALGWGVDAKDLIGRFRADPTDPYVTWITWMALTNVLPTLLHLGLGCAGLLGSWLMRDEAFARRLNELREAPVPSPIVGIEVPAKAAASAHTKLAQGLSEPQAAKLLNWVYFDGWLAIAFPFAAAFAVWPLWPRLMTWPLALLVP